MTGRRGAPNTTRTRGQPATPTGLSLVVPDPHRCILGYRLGRGVGQLVADFAGVVSTLHKLVGTAEL